MMRNHRRAVLTALAAMFMFAAAVGPADAHFRKANGKRVTRKHARMHRQQAQAAQAAQSQVQAAQELRAAARNLDASLQMYEAVVTGAQLQQLDTGGFDIVEVEQIDESEFLLTLVLYPWERAQLERVGIAVTVWTNDFGVTATELARQQTSAGFKVWRDYDGPDGIEAYLHQVAAQNPDITELVDIGDSWGTDPEGDEPDTPRDIYALQLTDDAAGFAGDQKPAVLYSSLQHAREWISVEVNRRLLEWFITRYRQGDRDIVQLLETTELWFILVANPDGYQYTFDYDRLWRKNLRDNDGDNKITTLDGVDPNRNFPEHWNYDDEGSASIFSDETYRGPSAASEPETQAMMGLYDNVEFAFHVNYHSFGELLLYTFGWQVNTPSADDPIFVALSGTDKHPAISHYDPGVGADLYTTNGETTDWAHAAEGTLAWTPELSEGPNGDGFVFPDHEGAVQSEFVINLPFALSVAKSAQDPDDPVTSTGIETEPFYTDVSQIDPQKNDNPLSEFAFPISYGDPQDVRILAKRDLDDDGDTDPVSVHWRVNNGRSQTASTSEWDGGDVYGGPGDVYYRIMSGTVTGFNDGDSVRVWFSGAGQTSEAFTFTVEEQQENPADVLILAAEDYSGAANDPPYASTTSPNYLSYYTSAIEASGRTWDVYDVDAMGRQYPHHLGVLSHYNGMVWYTGNDYLTREPGQAPGTGASTLANSEMLHVRAELNEDGRLLHTGRHAGWQFANAFEYNPVSTPPYCDGTVNESLGLECLLLSDDFLQYWLGAYLFIEDGGTNLATGEPLPIRGVDTPYTGTGWTLNGGTSADNHHPNAVRGTTQSFLTTSSILETSTYPQFTSRAPAIWEKPPAQAGAFSPHTGNWYVYSDRGDISYKRLMRTINVPAGGGQMTFWISRDTEPLWDFTFVEAHTVGQDNWTTLPDLNGHTSTSTGDSCPEGWHELHPWLIRYQGADCSGTGTTGVWHAASGKSAGWEQWRVDLTPYAGQQIELSISYASDWAIQGIGAFVDDIDSPDNAADTSFEGGMDGWTVPGPPPGSDPNPNDWFRTQDVGYQEGAVVTMDPPNRDFRTLFFGFGFEGVTTAAQRNDVMDRSLDYLLAP